MAPTVGTVAEAKATPAPATNGQLSTLEQLQADVARLTGLLGDALAENKKLRETPVINTGAAYGIIPASGKYDTSMKIALPHGGQLIGPRRKMLDIIEEVQSGRLAGFLNAHPEVK